MDVPIRDRRIQGYHVISPLTNPVDERGHFIVDDVTDVPSKLKLVMSIDGGGTWTAVVDSSSSFLVSRSSKSFLKFIQSELSWKS